MIFSSLASVASNGAMAVSLLAAAVLWPLLSRNYYQKQEKKEELYRRKKYVSYLEEKEELIKAYQHHNRWVSYLEVTGRKLPMILLLIDNYSVFRERMYKLEEDIIELAANAKTYGIFLVLTGNSRNAIYYKISEHIGTKIVFQLNDSQSYKELLNSRSSLEIEGIRGRALIRQDDMIAEMQVALPFETINEAQMYAKIKQIYRKSLMKDKSGTTTSIDLDNSVPIKESNKRIKRWILALSVMGLLGIGVLTSVFISHKHSMELQQSWKKGSIVPFITISMEMTEKDFKNYYGKRFTEGIDGQYYLEMPDEEGGFATVTFSEGMLISVSYSFERSEDQWKEICDDFYQKWMIEGDEWPYIAEKEAGPGSIGL